MMAPVTRPKRMIAAAALMLLGFAAGFLILEFGLRLGLYGRLQWRQSEYLPLIRAPHPIVGWKPLPNQKAMEEALEYQVMVTTNARGLRDLPRTQAKPEGTFRIVILGDSYMEAAHVEDADSFPRVLEGLLADRRVETINLGVGGYATTAAWLYLIEEGFGYAPDLVLLGFFAENDVHGNSQDLSSRFWREDNVRFYGQPYAAWNPESRALTIIPPDYARSQAGFEKRLAAYSPRLHRLDAFRKSLASHLYRQVLDHFRTRVRTPGYDVNIHYGCYFSSFSGISREGKNPLSAGEYTQLWDEAWFITKKLIRAIDTATKEHGVKFAFFNAPARIQFEAGYQAAVARRFPELNLDTDLPDRKLGTLAEEHGISFLDLTGAFRAADAAGQVVNYRRDSHWNAAGHRLAAETAARWLSTRELVPPCPLH